MLPMLGALIFAGFVVLGLAADVAVYAATYRDAAFAADTGAEAGAAMLAPPAAYEGDLALDPGVAADTAVAAAEAARPRPGRSASAAPEPGRICVTVTQPYQTRFLQALGVGPTTIVVTGCAEPRQG
jgi:hypothetical protein